MYKYYQPNSKDIKDNHSDCVIRAFCKATEKTWLEVFDELVSIARNLQASFNCKPVYEEFLKRNGFVYTGISNKKGSKRPTVEKFSKSTKSTCVLVVANHLVTCSEGHHWDTWDSGKKCLYGYWKKEGDII